MLAYSSAKSYKKEGEKALHHREMRAKSDNRQTTAVEPQIISQILVVCTRMGLLNRDYEQQACGSEPICG
jgi:hypothetical protein